MLKSTSTIVMLENGYNPPTMSLPTWARVKTKDDPCQHIEVGYESCAGESLGYLYCMVCSEVLTPRRSVGEMH